MTDIIRLTGVGPAMAKILKENGFSTAESIVTASQSELQTIPGIGAARAVRLKQAADAVSSKPASVTTESPKGSPVQPVKAISGQAIKSVSLRKSKVKATKGTQETKASDMSKGKKSEIEEALNSALAAAEAARVQAELKAAKAKAKAKKAAKHAESLMEEFAKAKEKARAKAKKAKAEARRAIEREKAKAKAILEGVEQKDKEKTKTKVKDQKAKSKSKSGSKKKSKK